MSKIKTAFAAILLSAATTGMPATAAVVAHVAIQIDESDADKMNMVLGNAENIFKYYNARGEEVVIEFVANGPGLTMMREDISPVKDRIEKMSETIPHLTFSACSNTIKGIKAKTGVDVVLIPQAQVVDSGVVRLMELQSKEGYSYLKP